MTPYFIMGGTGLVSLALAALLHRLAARRVVTLNLVAPGLGGFTAGLMTGCALMYQFNYPCNWVPPADISGDVESNTATQRTRLAPAMLARPNGMYGGGSVPVGAGAASGHPLPVGSLAPPLIATGWLNGPPIEASLANKLLVVDVWTEG
jgi:hypothetical protein